VTFDTRPIGGYADGGIAEGACIVSIDNWSDNILKVEPQDDPSFTDDLAAAIDRVSDKKDLDVVLSFASVGYLNSSNIAKLLKLRKLLITNKRRLVLCEINTNIWGLFLVTGLDKVFEFADNVSTALASVQLAPG
jgi:anti-anti-sigma factor